MVKAAHELREKGFTVLAVSLDRDWKLAKSVLPTKLPENFVVVLDPTLKSAELYGSYQYPESYLVGTDLKVLMKWVGPQDWSNAEVRRFLIEQTKPPQ